MKNFKVFILSLVSIGLMFLSNQRVVVFALAAANLFSLTSQVSAYSPEKEKTVSVEQQASTAVQAIINPSFSASDGAISGAMGSLSSGQRSSKGIQFKAPILSTAFSYTALEDSAVGGMDGNQYAGELGLDADIYDGLIVGMLYQHTYKSTRNELNTNDHLDANAISVYAAKRFLNLINAGLAYGYVATDEHLSLATTLNLSRDANSVTPFIGFSDRKGKWSYGSTASFTYNHDNYQFVKDLDTGRVGLNVNGGYDFAKWFTFGVAGNYYNFPIQDTFAGTTVRDEDYWTVGPQMRFYPVKNLTLNLGFDTTLGYKDLESYMLRVGVEYGF